MIVERNWLSTGWRALLAAAVLSGLVALAVLSPARARDLDEVTLTPSYTIEQATRGRTVYGGHCAACHGAELQGGGGGALKGPAFDAQWAGRKTTEFYETVAVQMPLTAPGSLTEADYVNVIAYILAKNGYPSGPSSLTRSVMRQTGLVRMSTPRAEVAPEGPMPVLPGSPRIFGTPKTNLPSAAELLDHEDGANWLMYNRSYNGQRFSRLSEINTGNVSRLSPTCALQLGFIGAFQASPVVYNGVMYLTAGNNTYALDARNCHKLWEYSYIDKLGTRPAVMNVNRGVAIYEGALLRATPSGHLIAIDLQDGRLLWDEWVLTTRNYQWLSAAPVVFDGKVYIGEGGAESGTPGRMHAFDVKTGKHLWKFDFIPTGNQFGADTWVKGAESGGGSTWTSYAVDPQAGLIYVPVGNPAPDFDVAGRPGDNLFTNSVVALDARTGKLAWYVQQLSHDMHDWDTAAAPVLYERGGRKYMAVATKGGWMFIYDRDTHRQVAKVEISTHENAQTPLTVAGVHACPGIMGGAEWNGPAFDPGTGSLFVNSVDWCATFHLAEPAASERSAPAGMQMGGIAVFDPVETASGWVRSFDAVTGHENWRYRSPTPMVAGVTPTAGGLLLTGDLKGNFLAMDAASGKILYSFNTGGAIGAGISTYTVDGKQYIAVPSGNASRVWAASGSATLLVFALPEG